jgi:hypothetical protein
LITETNNKGANTMKKSIAEDLAKLETSEIEKLFKGILNERWEEEFCRRYGVDEKICPCPGIGSLINADRQDNIIHPPGADHFALWARDGEPFAYTMHYYCLKGASIAKLYAFCEKNGLQFWVEGRGFCSDGVAFRIVITKQKKS